MLMIVVILMIGVLSAAFVPKAKAATLNYHLYGSASAGWGFSPTTMTSPGPIIEVHVGDIVNLTLTSQDKVTHQFFVDYNGNGVPDSGEPESPSFTGTIVYKFTANTVGNVTYYCVFHPSVMHGPFHVLPAIPEFPRLVFLPLFMMLTLLAVVLFKHRRQCFENVKSPAHNSVLRSCVEGFFVFHAF